MHKKILLFLLLTIVTEDLLSQTIKGKLYYDLGNRKSKSAADLIVYLIPNNRENQRIIGAASQYEVACKEENIKSAKGYRITVTDKEGNFFFNNINKGRYLIKICTYYGGYYNINIKANFKGTISLPRFEADPPIKGG